MTLRNAFENLAEEPTQAAILAALQAGIQANQGNAGATPWPVDIGGATVSISNLQQLAINTDIAITGYNLQSTAYSADVPYSVDSLLSSLFLRFTTNESRNITVSKDDGTIIVDLQNETALEINIDFENLGIDSNTTVTVAISQTTGACLVDITLLSQIGTASLGGSARIAAPTLDGDVIDIPLGGYDPNNSWIGTGSFPGSAPYTLIGSWRRSAGFESMLAFAFSDIQLTTCKIEWSYDGVNVAGSLLASSALTETFTSGFYIYLSALTTFIAPYHRFVIEAPSIPTTFESYTWLYDEGFSGSFGALNSTLSNISSALLTRSVIAGTDTNGNFRNAIVTKDAALTTSVNEVGERLRFKSQTADRALSGQLISYGFVDDISIDFSRSGSINSMLDESANGGSISLSNSMLFIQSGTGATGKGQATSMDNIVYRTANEIRACFTAVWSTPSANGKQWVGPMDSAYQDGFFIGYEGTVFGFGYCRGGSLIDFIPMTSWTDPPDGNANSLFRRDNIPEALNPQYLNLFRIRWEHLGIGPCLLEAQNPDGEWTKLHIIRFPNSQTIPNTNNPSLPILYRCEKTSGAENLTISSGSVRGGTTGSDSGLRLSQFPNRSHIGSRITAISVSTSMITVTAGSRFYMTGFTMTAINSNNTPGQFNLRDGSAGLIKIPLIVPSKQGSGPDGSATVAVNFLEPMQFDSEVYSEIIGIGITASASIVGYEEIL